MDLQAPLTTWQLITLIAEAESLTNERKQELIEKLLKDKDSVSFAEVQKELMNEAKHLEGKITKIDTEIAEVEEKLLED